MTGNEKQITEHKLNLYKLIVNSQTKPSEFCKNVLNREPHDYNIPYIDDMGTNLIYRSGRRTGKSFSTAVKVLHAAWYMPTLKEMHGRRSATIMLVAPTQAQANIIMEACKELAAGSEIFMQYAYDLHVQSMRVRWINEPINKRPANTWIFAAAAGDKGTSTRGYTNDVLVVDEAAFVRDSIFYSAAPSKLGTVGGKMWYTSTPFGSTGYFFEVCNKAKMGNKPVDDVHSKLDNTKWTQYNAATWMNPYVTEDDLKEFRNWPKDQYEQEIEGRFAGIGNRLIAPKFLISASEGGEIIPEDCQYALGVDVGHGGDDTVYCLIAHKKERVWLKSIEGESTRSLVKVADKIEDLNRVHYIAQTYVDATAMGHGVVDMLKDRGLTVNETTFSIRTKRLMYENVIRLFEEELFKFSSGDKNKTLMYQLSYMNKRLTPDRVLKIESEKNDDYPDALALACQVMYQGDPWVLASNEDGSILTWDGLFSA